MATATRQETDRPAALQARTLCEAFQMTVAERGDAIALRTLGGGQEISWREYGERVERIARGLHALGVRPGDTVALMMVNRPEFALCDTAAMHLGATPFSIYNTSAPEQVTYLFGNAGCRVVITEPQFLETIRAAETPSVEHIVLVDGDEEGTIPLSDLEATEGSALDFDAAWRAVNPEHVLTLIYTSGTTGPPKGVELTHANMMAELQAVDDVLPMAPAGRGVSFLPSAHLADRWASHYTGMAYGTTITSVADPRQVVAALPEVRPTFWGSVPRIWEKIKAAIEAKVAADPDDARREAVQGALAAAQQKVRLEQAGEPVPEELAAGVAAADEHIFSAMREQLGLDQCEILVSGAAPIPAEVLEFFMAIGLPVCELWGMSETSCCATINPPGAIRIGTVGVAVEGAELKLAEDGELLMRGPLIMRGYRDDPERTAEAIDPEGWLHTGDVATIDEDGYVRIVDRKKELIINAAGKNMSPANIEAKLKSSSDLVGQACVIGDRRPFNVALIVPDPDAVGPFAAAHGIEPTVAAVARSDEGRSEIAAGVERANAQLSRVEQIKRFHILDSEWLPGGDELTPTMKLKRKPVAEKFAEEIEALYV